LRFSEKIPKWAHLELSVKEDHKEIDR